MARRAGRAPDCRQKRLETMVEADRIEGLAEISVARGCGFAGLAIGTFMVGLSWDMALASKVGGLLVLFVCVVLTVKAHRAVHRPVRNTELWMMLGSDRPSPAVAQHLVGEALRGCYLRFALHAASLGIVLLVLSLGLQLVGHPALEVAAIE
jgi:hypothetical protein